MLLLFLPSLWGLDTFFPPSSKGEWKLCDLQWGTQRVLPEKVFLDRRGLYSGARQHQSRGVSKRQRSRQLRGGNFERPPDQTRPLYSRIRKGAGVSSLCINT